MLRIFVIAMALVACGEGDGGGGGNSKIDASSPGDGAMSDGPRVDASMMGIDAAITPGPACGATTCTLGQQECCIGVVSVCKPAGMCPSQAFACDGPEDCPNAVCCFPNNNGSRCQTNNCQDIACHKDADCPGGVPKCCPKAFTPGYNVCQAQC
jgi:hypothetical protein